MMSVKQITATTLLIAAALLFMSATAFTAQKSKIKKAPKGDSYTIRSDSASYSLEDETFKIDGAVTVESSKVKIEGSNLFFDKKNSKGKVSGSPAKLSYEKSTSANVDGTISFDVKNETAQASGDISVAYSTGTTKTDMRCGSLFIDLKNELSDASGNVVFVWRDSAAEKEQAGKAEDATGTFKTSPATLKTGRLKYNMKTGEVTARETVTAELPDARLTAKTLTASLKDKTIEARGGFTLESENDISATSDHAIVRFGDKTALLTGNVSAMRGEDSVKADSVEIDYNKGRRSIVLTGGVDITIHIESDNNKQENGETIQ